MIKRILLMLCAIAFCGVVSAQTYIRDAEQGDANAQYRLGKMYERADRMPKDISKALYWYGKAAEQNHPKAEILHMKEISFSKI